MAVAQGGRWRRVQAGRPAGLVGMVSHRPLPGLPDEVGMARETRALPGRPSGYIPGSFRQLSLT